MSVPYTPKVWRKGDPLLASDLNEFEDRVRAGFAEVPEAGSGDGDGSGDPVVLPPALSDSVRLVLGANTRVELPSVPPVGFIRRVTIIQDSVGSRVPIWPTGIYWQGGPPELDNTPDSRIIIQFFWDGVNWYATVMALALTIPVAPTTQTLYNKTFAATNTLPEWTQLGGVAFTAGGITINPGASVWASHVGLILGASDDPSGITTGSPAVVSDFNLLMSYSLLDLNEQYPIIGLRVRAVTWNGDRDDIWIGGPGDNLFKSGYSMQLSPKYNKIVIYDGFSTEQLADIPFDFTTVTKDMMWRIVGSGKKLSLRVFKQGTTEPTTWLYENPTILNNQQAGSIGLLASNGPDAVSKTVTVKSALLTTPIITAKASQAAPTTDPAGFTRIYTENFDTVAGTGTGPTSVNQVYKDKFQMYDDAGKYWARLANTVHDGYMDITLDGTKGSAGSFGSGFGSGLPDEVGTQIGGRFAMRAMALNAERYGTAVMLWPSTGVWADGEIDYPESNFEDSPMIHHHHMTVGDEGSNEALTTGVSWRDWHVYAIEWKSGEFVKYYLDDVLIMTVTENVPNTPHRYMYQVGFNEDDAWGAPGHMLIDWVTISKNS